MCLFLPVPSSRGANSGATLPPVPVAELVEDAAILVEHPMIGVDQLKKASLA